MASFLSAAPAASAPKQFQAANKIHYILGDVTEPLGDKSRTRVILNFIDDSRTWPDRGVFAAISAKFKKAEDAYLKNADKLPLGESMIVRVKPKSEGNGSIYVGLYVILEKAGQGKLPSFKPQFLDQLFQQTLEWAQTSDVGSIHLARPRKDTPGLLWPIVEASLVTHFVDNGIDACILPQRTLDRTPRLLDCIRLNTIFPEQIFTQWNPTLRFQLPKRSLLRRKSGH
jgi:hypothetical protein